jgi:hypothetical protein
MDIIGYSKETNITPFWNRIPTFFLYGFKSIPLLLAVLSGILLYMFSNIWPSMILYAIGVKYSMAALSHTAPMFDSS